MSWEGIEDPITTLSVKFLPGQRAKYVANNRSFGAFMRSEQMRDVTADAAKDIARLAAIYTGAASENEPSDMFPPIKAGFKVKREAGLMKVDNNLRVKVTVYNNADGAALAEFGAGNITRRRMLARAGSTFHPNADFKPGGTPS